MALTAQDMGNMGRLAQLAANPQGVGRDEIYVAVTSLFRAQAAHLSARERELMKDIIQRLSRDVEMAVRIAVAERLADDEDAPVDLILMLCDDRIEVAAPLIARSRKLSDSEILKFVVEASAAHQVAVAARPYIGDPVTNFLATSEHETVLVTLVRNATASIGETAFNTLVEKSKTLESLHGPLVDRGDLPPVLATQMCDWISAALKEHVVKNFNVPKPKIAAVVNTAKLAVQLEPVSVSSDPNDNKYKLADKLFAAGQLKAGFLLRVLHQGQIDMFDIAFSKLLNVDVERFRASFYGRGPRAVALACRAVGIDRSVFATVFNLSRQSRSIIPTINNDERSDVERVFASMTKRRRDVGFPGRAPRSRWLKAATA